MDENIPFLQFTLGKPLRHPGAGAGAAGAPVDGLVAIKYSVAGRSLRIDGLARPGVAQATRLQDLQGRLRVRHPALPVDKQAQHVVVLEEVLAVQDAGAAGDGDDDVAALAAPAPGETE